ncbi:MAG: apolipoprotein N-acyltransferase [Novosphingobium sp.]|nr:apolipoprotein N-acyltransferase [Novosphingobium sp.]
MLAIRTLLNRLAGFPRLGALAAGAISACGFQPLAIWPLTILAIAWWIELLARARSWRTALLLGWLFGISHFTVGNYWIATAFNFQAEMPQWLGSIAVVLTSLYLAIFPALAGLVAWLACKRFSTGAINSLITPLPALGLAIAGCWIVTEWLRSWLFTGFAWNPLGIVLLGSYQTQGLALTAKWIGTYGLSGLLVIFAAILRQTVRVAHIASAGQRMALLAGTVTLAALLGALMTTPSRYLARSEGAQPFTLVQPDVRQEVLGDPKLYEFHFQKIAGLTLPSRPNDKRVVFWPESGLPDYLRDGYPARLYRLRTYGGDPVVARERLGEVIGPYGLLLTGAVDVVVEDDDHTAVRNSVTAVDWRGNILASYSKAHLVPFGEYLPMRDLLEPIGLSRLVAGTLDFWPGPGPRSIDFGDWGEVGIQICYEIVFSGQVVDPENRPDYIFNPSNDGWFGSWGPPQHLAHARLRALEEGLPVMRATTTGISAVIDSDGIVRQFVPRHSSGRLDGMIPPAHEPTLFASHGNALPLLFAGLLFLVSLVAMRCSKR